MVQYSTSSAEILYSARNGDCCCGRGPSACWWQVAGSTVVFKTRARRLYDIANALAAVGLVDKVRYSYVTQDTPPPPLDRFSKLYEEGGASPNRCVCGKA